MSDLAAELPSPDDPVGLAADLRAFAPFRELADDDLEPVVAMTRRQSCPAGQRLFYDHDEADALFLVVAGLVAIHVVSIAPAYDIPLARVFPGEVIGEFGLFGFASRSAAATALVDSELLRVELPALRRWCAERPAAGLVVLREAGHILADRLSKANRRLVKIYRQSAP